MSHLDPIAYTYEADYHCPSCAFARFGEDEHGFVPEDAEDYEGNGVGALAPWEEWYSNDVYEGNDSAILVCGTCSFVIKEINLSEES
jgi:hypothetical protein